MRYRVQISETTKHTEETGQVSHRTPPQDSPAATGSP